MRQDPGHPVEADPLVDLDPLVDPQAAQPNVLLWPLVSDIMLKYIYKYRGLRKHVLGGDMKYFG